MRASHGLPSILRALPAALLLAGAVATPACAPPERGRSGRGVLVIAIDSLRADHVGFAGYDRETTPTIDSLANSGAAFLQAFGAAPDYVPAHAAILTGCDPRLARRPVMPGAQFRSMSHNWRLPSTVPSLAREYLAAGYATAAFADHPWISDTLGFDNGFEDFYGFREGAVEGLQDFGFPGVASRFYRWLQGLDSDRDWFAYLTISDLERAWQRSGSRFDSFFKPRPELDRVPPVAEAWRAFFAVPRRYASRGDHVGGDTLGDYEARYDGMLRQLDTGLARLLLEMQLRGRLESTTICIVGTFGVGFGESGLILDHGTLSDVDLHIPLVVRPSAETRVVPGTRSTQLASTVDIMPTLLEISGLRAPRGMHGRSLLPLMQGGSEPVHDYVYAMGGVHDGFSVRDERWSYELIRPGLRGPGNLAAMWSGNRSTTDIPRRAHLRDRRSSSGLGDLEPSADDPEAARRLREAGQEWYGWLNKARDVLHDEPWHEEPVDPKLVEELRRRGIIE